MNAYVDQIIDIVHVAVRPFVAFLYSDSMIYWPYLLSTLVLAIGVPAISALSSRQDALETLRQQFSKKIWWTESTKADYRYYIINSFVFGFIFAPFLIASADTGIWINGQLTALLGTRTESLLEPTSIRILYTILFFVAYDFGRFLAHWTQHQVPFLWHFHMVHHSAETLTPLTAFRVHPVDLMLMASGGNLFGGIVAGIFFYISAGEVSIYTFLGTHLLIAVYNMIGNLRHTHVWLDYGLLGYVFLSPAQHQIHHSTEDRHIGKNCGFGLAFWDGLFGTLYVPKSKETFARGLGDGSDGEWHSVGRMYLRPVQLLRQSFRTLPGLKS